jgi:hypothetical protein
MNAKNTFLACSDSGTKPASAGQPGVEQAVGDATDAYIYGYPLVTMELTRLRLTSVAEPGLTGAPMGQLWKLRTYPVHPKNLRGI